MCHSDVGENVDWSLPAQEAKLPIVTMSGYLTMGKAGFCRHGGEDDPLTWDADFAAGVSMGMVSDEGLGEGEGHGWELLVDAGGLEEAFGAMQLDAAGTCEGFTLLQLTACMPGVRWRSVAVFPAFLASLVPKCCLQIMHHTTGLNINAGGVDAGILEAGIIAASKALGGQLDFLESVIKQVWCTHLPLHRQQQLETFSWGELKTNAEMCTGSRRM